MKLIRNNQLTIQERPDGRTVTRILQHELNAKFSSIQNLYVVHPPELKEELHYHKKSYEALYFLDKANYKINSEYYEINPGDFILFEPGDIHGAVPIKNETRILVFQVPAIIDDKFIVSK